MLMYKYMPPDEVPMAEYRAIMTTTDRERITGEADVPDSKRYEATSRIRSRIDELETDVEILAEHRPDLLDELREVVCEEGDDD